MAAYLGSVCDDGRTFFLLLQVQLPPDFTVFVVPALPNDTNIYQGPTIGQVNQCGCSSVFYSLLSACSDCQSAQVLTFVRVCHIPCTSRFNYLTSWTVFNKNCTTVYTQLCVPYSSLVQSKLTGHGDRFNGDIPSRTAVPHWVRYSLGNVFASMLKTFSRLIRT